jgi:DNA mismatch repair protein MutS2
MAKHASPETLVLADELGSGTDPEEGAALGQALLEHFAARRTWGVVTTHLGQLKRVAGQTPGVVNGSLEYDAVAMRPRYRFLPGVPGASHGLEVASRMGVPEEVLARARALTPETSRSVELLLQSLQKSSREMQEERDRWARARRAAEEAEQAHRGATESAKQSLSQLRARLTRESEAVLAQVRELWQFARREARRAEKSKTQAEEIKTRMDAADANVDSLHRRAALAAGESHDRDALPREGVTIGRRVRVADLGGVIAEVAALPDADGRVVLKRGSWSIQGQVGRLYPVEESGGSEDAPAGKSAVTWSEGAEELPLQVDLRGMDTDDALRTVDTGLDRATLAGLHELRIIHGLGKGVLKTAVERHLRGHPQVAKQRMGELYEGGRGVTVATLT